VDVVKIRYQPLAGHYDELLLPSGGLRPHWQPLFDTLDSLGRKELNRRWEASNRIIRDNGMTFNVHLDDGRGGARPWPFDLLPFIISSAEWANIEKGVAQRARLLNETLADLYGPQRLIKNRILPPEYIYAHPGFLRPCHGLKPPGGHWLHVYAVDLARSPAGAWVALGERTEVPMGAGFALENRLVSAKVLPEAIDASSVRRLARYFRIYQDTLSILAPGRRENPRIVLLSPGPDSETFFEHAFLARYLGYSLVEGADLTVRDRHVYLKTLGGLLPVDLIVRRQESHISDPLEFAGNSVVGIPGLLDSVRAGNVVVVNQLGSGLAESAALAPFAPAVCQELLGEDLLVPSVDTWWCGQKAATDHVLTRLDELVIKLAFPGSKRELQFGRRMSDAQRERLRREIQKRPCRYVAQNQLSLSTVPVRTAEGYVPRYAVIRVFAVASGDSYAVMPGGLARVSSSVDSMDVSVIRGGHSKDIWVIDELGEAPVTLLPKAKGAIDVSRATFDLPSRVAENLFWLGRYSERVDAGVRLIRAVLPLLSDETTSRSDSDMTGALNFLKEMGYLRLAEAAASPTDAPLALARELRSIVTGTTRETGFASQVRQLHRVTWLLRDRLSADAWRIINRLENDFARTPDDDRLIRGGLEVMLDRAVMNIASFSGSVMEGMTRGHGWRLLDIGRRLERALQTIELLRHGLGEGLGDEWARIELLLEVADSAITYRSRYLTSLQADLAIDLLLIDEANPRAVAFQLARLREHVEQLPEGSTPMRRSPEFRFATDALAAVQLAELSEVARVVDGHRPGLEALADRLGEDLRGLSHALTQDYLTHAAPFRQLANQ
jgi:uncharacterized circularly permuted ATP-grasp superfamily protein/uncharacterized alpha-E superfamily protein